MFDGQFITYAVYFFVVTTVILTVEAGYVAVSARRGHRGAVNYRLGRLAGGADVESALASLRKERGLDESGNYRYPIIFLNRLYLQSGRRGSGSTFLWIFFTVGSGAAIVVFMFVGSILVASIAFAAGALGLPVLVLMRRRARRMARFARQLPDAIDIVVRSLKAGHPTPVSIALVAREMPDPIGTEFGIVSDEMTYGLELDMAMRNLLERVGLDDLRLIVVSMGIQASTGGNLAEILANLSQVIRDRFRMRQKINALSAEGRWSAIILSVFPFFLFTVIWLISPGYYGDVLDQPIVIPALVLMLLWMTFGDFIMYRMVHFDF